MIKESKLKLRATDLHEMLRCWENNHRVLAAEAHLKPIQFREERRYPGDNFRADFLDIDDDHWKSFVYAIYDHKTGEQTVFKQQDTSCFGG